MRNKSIILTVLLTFLIASFAIAGDKYGLDLVHSSVGFSVKHLVISNTKGFFKDFDGVIILNETINSIHVIFCNAHVTFCNAHVMKKLLRFITVS